MSNTKGDTRRPARTDAGPCELCGRRIGSRARFHLNAAGEACPGKFVPSTVRRSAARREWTGGREPTPPLDVLYLALAEAVEATSLREVARQLKMAPTGVSKVLAGTDPLPQTIRKLEAWWLSRALMDPALPAGDERVRAAALHLLTRSLPPHAQPAAIDALQRILGKWRESP